MTANSNDWHARNITRESCNIVGMKNVTITLDEEAAAWARKQAAEDGISLSRFVGALLEKTMRESREYESSMRQYLSRKPVRLSHGTAYPSRAELYDRNRLR